MFLQQKCLLKVKIIKFFLEKAPITKLLVIFFFNEENVSACEVFLSKVWHLRNFLYSTKSVLAKFSYRKFDAFRKYVAC